jgi:SnoaL-like domain
LTHDHPHARLLERIYTTVAEGDLSLFEASVTEPFVCHGAGDPPLGGRFVGLDAMKHHIAQIYELSGGTLRQQPLGFFADALWGIVPQIQTASRDDRALEMQVAGFWRFSGPGQLVEHWEAVSDVSAWNAFWSR